MRGSMQQDAGDGLELAYRTGMFQAAFLKHLALWKR